MPEIPKIRMYVQAHATKGGIKGVQKQQRW